jgi:hypothetical protein
MQERNVIGASTAAVISPLVDFYLNLAPFLMLALILIIVDSRFGVLAARKRGETIRPSRKWRRAINKLVDYICWITLAGMIGRTFGESFHIPILSTIVLLIVYGIELSSIVNNYFEYKGINKVFNIWKLFGKFRQSEIVTDVIEEKEEEKEENDEKDSDR